MERNYRPLLTPLAHRRFGYAAGSWWLCWPRRVSRRPQVEGGICRRSCAPYATPHSDFMGCGSGVRRAAMYFYGTGIGRPLTGPEAIRSFLPSSRAHHYKVGRSMAETARCWMEDPGHLPPRIAVVVGEDRATSVHFEYEQAVYGGGKSQTDVMAFAGSSVIAVEAKVDEKAGPTVEAWLAGQKAEAKNRSAALERYSVEIGVAKTALMPLRYQFLHRALSAALVANARRADEAWMIVQLFPSSSGGFDLVTQRSFREFMEAVSGRLTLAGRQVSSALVLCQPR